MPIERFYFTFFILFVCLNSCKSIRFSYSRSNECTNPILHIDNGGLIQSHRHFGVTPYPNKIDCSWVILAPSNFQIMVQFNFLNIESDNSCSFDYLEFSTTKNSSIKVCGNDDRKRLLFPSNELLILFHSDGSTTFEGFQFRYLFVRSDDANSINLSKTNVPCAYNEWKCRFLNTCIPKSWRCDNIRDCRDNSDEMECFVYRSCHQSQQRCLNGGCVPSEFACNGIGDCADGSDEIFCNLNTTFDPFKPSIKNECSYQSIKPIQLDDSIDNSQIVGGSEATPGSWPWMISLKYGPSHMCGGSLITEDLVLTAAHCFIMDPNPDYYNVDLGRHFLYKGLVENIGVKNIIIHPSYNVRTQDFDIAIVKLKRKVKLTASIQTVCIPSDQEPIAGKKCVILGWGSTQGTGGEGVLKQAIVPIVERKVCKEMLSNIITNQMICAGYKTGGIDSCSGDSGGPLVCETEKRFVLYGIVSFGQGCALPNRPGVYTNVVQLVDWINKEIESSLPLQTSTIATTNISTKSSNIQSQSTKGSTAKNILFPNPSTKINNNFNVLKSSKTVSYQTTTEINKFETISKYSKQTNTAMSLKTTNTKDFSPSKVTFPKSVPTSSFVKDHLSTSTSPKITEDFQLKSTATKQSNQSPGSLHSSTSSPSDSTLDSVSDFFHKTENLNGIRKATFYPTEITAKEFYNSLSTRNIPKTKQASDLHFSQTAKYIKTAETRRPRVKTPNKSTISSLLINMSESFRTSHPSTSITNNYTNFNGSVLN